MLRAVGSTDATVGGGKSRKSGRGAGNAKGPNGGGGGPPPATDPDFANVVALLHFDGSNGSTTFTDNAPTPKTYSVGTGSPTIATAQSKFGGSSLTVPGTARITATSADFSLDTSWTIECWLYLPSLPTEAGAVWSCDPGGGSGCEMLVNTVARVGINLGGGNTYAPANSLVATTWQHIAASCVDIGGNGRRVRIFVDGVQQVQTDMIVPVSHTVASIGARANNTVFLNGYIDDLRITKGVARYTANFTPPTAAFPNS